MKDYPILFSTDMVKAILDGNKTMTRRVVNPQPEVILPEDVLLTETWAWKTYNFLPINELMKLLISKCHYGQVGGRLWVRETWAAMKLHDRLKPRDIPINSPVWYKCNQDIDEPSGCADDMGKWRPSIFMPRWASRITLEIVNIKVERIQDITEEDAIAEGIPAFQPIGRDKMNSIIPRSHFASLWDKLNAKRGYSWGSNPWVWVIEFKRC